MSNTLAVIYRILSAIVAAQGLIVADLAAFNPSARVVSGVFGVIALVALLVEFVLGSPSKTSSTPSAPPAPPKIG